MMVYLLRGSFFLFEAYEYCAHIVHSVLTGAVLGDELIKKLFYDALATNLFVLSGDSFVYPLDHLIITFHLPYTVTPHYNKIYTVRLHFRYVWVGCDHLVLRFHPWLFVL